MSPPQSTIDDELNRVLSDGLTFSDFAEFCQIPPRQTAQVRPQVYTHLTLILLLHYLVNV